MRALLDVNILVRANEKSLGPARALLLALIAQDHPLLVCEEMLFDVARILRYPRMQTRRMLTEEQIYDYIQFLRQACEFVPVDRSIYVPMRDPKDVVVLQAAVAGGADIICTWDSDFLRSRHAYVLCRLRDRGLDGRGTHETAPVFLNPTRSLQTQVYVTVESQVHGT